MEAGLIRVRNIGAKMSHSVVTLLMEGFQHHLRLSKPEGAEIPSLNSSIYIWPHIFLDGLVSGCLLICKHLLVYAVYRIMTRKVRPCVLSTGLFVGLGWVVGVLLLLFLALQMLESVDGKPVCFSLVHGAVTTLPNRNNFKRRDFARF